MHTVRLTANRRRGVGTLIRSFVVGLVAVVGVGCSGDVVLEPTQAPVIEPKPIAETGLPDSDAMVINGGNEAELALKASETFFTSAQAVVLASVDEPESMMRGASIAVALGTPLLLTLPPGLTMEDQEQDKPNQIERASGNLNTELLRLGTRAVLTVGGVSLHQLDTTSLVVQPVPDDVGDVEALLDREFRDVEIPSWEDAPHELTTLREGQLYRVSLSEETPDPYGRFPETLPAKKGDSATVIADQDERFYAAIATAKAAGATMYVGHEPASDPRAVALVEDNPDQPVIRIGGQESEEDLEHIVASMRGGDLLPSGGQRVYLSKGQEVEVVTLNASRALSRRGIDDASAVFDRARDRALRVEKVTGGAVEPGVEVNVERFTREELEYWVTQAQIENQYLILTIEPTTDFVPVLREYEDLLIDPRVGVSLGAESDNLEAGQINDAIVYLRHLVREHDLPQKIAVVDLGERSELTTPESLTSATWEVALTISVDEDSQNQWETWRGKLPTNPYWAVAIFPVEGENVGSDKSTIKYPPVKDTARKDEANLMTYR